MWGPGAEDLGELRRAEVWINIVVVIGKTYCLNPKWWLPALGSKSGV
jgi:hypothetical protein